MRIGEIWNRFSLRERALAGATLVILLGVVLRYGVVHPYLAYKTGLEDAIAQEALRIEKSLRKISQGPQVRSRLSRLRQKRQEVVSRLIPGETPSLAAARLQERLQKLASQSQVEIVTTQVMPEEKVEAFHRTSVRLTLRGELPSLAHFLTAVEYDSWWLTIDTLDIRGYARRGRYRRNQRGVPPLTVTLEVGGFMQGSLQAQKTEG